MTPFSLTREQVRELDRRAIQEYGVPGVVLMENAGRGVAELLLRLNSEHRRVLILCGPGNNGGDGFVIARHLQNAEVPVDLLLFGDFDRIGGDARVNADVWRKCGPMWIVPVDRPLDADFRRVIEGAHGWIVDALFGTGLARALACPFDEVIDAVNSSGLPVLAVDLPSGLDCDSGEPLGPTIRAAHTATFVAEKSGFANAIAAKWLGEIHVLDIGAPKNLVDEYKTK